MKTVYGAHVNTVGVFTFYAFLSNYVGHNYETINFKTRVKAVVRANEAARL